MHNFRVLRVFYALLLYSQVAYAIAPPSPAMSYTDLGGGRVRISEDKWTKDTNVEVVGKVNLTADREVKGIWMDEKNSPEIHLKGNTLTVGKDGIYASYSDHRPYITSGKLTSSDSFLTIQAKTYGSSQIDSQGNKVTYRIRLESAIVDHKDHKIGLRITGEHPDGESGQVDLFGKTANTFTGDVIVEGLRNTLHLNKEDGVTAIRGNIAIRKQAAMNIVGNNQIADTSTITLSGRSTLSFSSAPKAIEEKVHALVVEDGISRLAFWHDATIDDNFTKKLILDDLVINDRAALRISNWKAGRDYLLVRKDSAHLEDAKKKITIDGWGKNQVYLKDYDDDYWSIEAAPEPAVYGAILGAVGLGLVHWRRGRRSCHGRPKRHAHIV